MSNLETVFNLYSGTKHRGSVPERVLAEKAKCKTYAKEGYSFPIDKIGKFKSTKSILREVYFDGELMVLVERRVRKVNEERP